MTRFLALPLALTLAAPAALGPAAAQQPQETTAGYVFVPVTGGALRLNTESGEVSLCSGANGAGACAPVRDAGRGAAQDVARLEDRLAALEARIAALEARGPLETLTDDASLDRVMVLADRMMRRFVKIVQDMKEDVESGEL